MTSVRTVGATHITWIWKCFVLLLILMRLYHTTFFICVFINFSYFTSQKIIVNLPWISVNKRVGFSLSYDTYYGILHKAFLPTKSAPTSSAPRRTGTEQETRIWPQAHSSLYLTANHIHYSCPDTENTPRQSSIFRKNEYASWDNIHLQLATQSTGLNHTLCFDSKPMW